MSVMEMAAKTKFADLTFDQKLDRLAEVAVQIGLGLRAGQELIMSAPIEALPLVRRITEHAYKAGALLVTTFYSDDPSVLARYEYATDASFDYAPTWLHDAIAAGFRSGAARLAIAGANPALLAKQDPARVARANVAASKAGGRQTRDGVDYAPRNQLDDCGMRNAGVGKAGVSRRAGECRRCKAVGGDLRCLACRRR